MAGIIINPIENVDEELNESNINKNNLIKLMESKKAKYQKMIDERNRLNKQKENNKKETSVTVKTTPDGTVTETTTSNEDGSTTTTTVDSPETTIEETGEGTGHDPEWENEQIKIGNDPSDVKAGDENKIPDKPDNPREDAKEATKDSNSNVNNNGTQCNTDEIQNQKDETPKNTKPNDTKQDENANLDCHAVDETGLNDLQKEVLWTAIDMLKWQPTTDTVKGRKRKWKYINRKDKLYANTDYPRSPIFDMHSDVKGMSPVWRLMQFYHGMFFKNVMDAKVKDAEIDIPWCAKTVSVIYCLAMANLEVTHENPALRSSDKVSLGKYKNNPNYVPFSISTTSSTVARVNAKKFGYPVSFEPSIGSIFFKSNAQNERDKCGHTGIVVGITNDKGIVTIEGNGASDYSLRYFPREYYYSTAWKYSFPTKGKGPYHPQSSCSIGGSTWKGIRPEFPTKSIWHWVFVNPCISKNLIWKNKSSRPENPLTEIKSLMSGFYNPEHGLSADEIDTKTD